MQVAALEIQGPPLEAAARIGRAGGKIHPVIVYADGYMTFRCCCAGTANGAARNFALANGLFLGVPATCRGR
jgi:hypothetical protein